MCVCAGLHASVFSALSAFTNEAHSQDPCLPVAVCCREMMIYFFHLQEKCLCVLGALMRNMTALIRRDQNDRVLPHLLPPLLPVVTMLSLREVLGLVNSLAKGPAQVHPPRPALIMAGSSHFGATLLARLIQQGNSASLDEGGPTEKEW